MSIDELAREMCRLVTGADPDREVVSLDAKTGAPIEATRAPLWLAWRDQARTALAAIEAAGHRIERGRGGG